tara:strand:- start:311 stop:1486 length:1176 start_codon:yes stop_codon:yes gene_type:complete
MEYKYVCIKDICSELFSGSTPSSAKFSSSKNYFHGCVTFLGGGSSTREGKYNPCSNKYYSEQALQSKRGYELEERDTLITIVGNVGDICFVPELILPAYINQNLIALRANTNLVLKDYLYLAMLGIGCPALKKLVNQTAQPSVNAKQVENIKIPLPQLTQQEKIVKIIKGFDKVLNSLKEKEKTYVNLIQSMINEFTTIRDSSVSNVKNFGDIVENSRKKTTTSLPIYSVTIHSGMVPRNQLGRSVISELKNEGYIYAEKGDLCYNMMRMWQGASGIAPIDCLVSPAYVVCKPLSGILPEYLGLICESSYCIDQFKRSSRGITSDRWRLYFDDFSKIKIGIPSIEKQRKILDLVKNQKQLLKKLQKKYQTIMHLKTSLMNDLLTGRKKINF